VTAANLEELRAEDPSVEAIAPGSEEADAFQPQARWQQGSRRKGGDTQALREAETLLADTIQLVRARTDADISSFCEELSQRRRAVDPPSAEHRSEAR
jgi:hypothetical protein